MTLVTRLTPLVRAALVPDTWAFDRARADPQAAVRALQRTLLDDAVQSARGQEIGLGAHTRWDDLPVVTYDDLRSDIDAERRDGRPRLSRFRARRFEPTSGTSGHNKYIPYTAPLLSSFRRLFAVWLRDLLTHGPTLQSGKTFLSVSPPPVHATDALDDDAYLAVPTRLALSSFLVRPYAARRVTSFRSFRRRTLLRLLLTPDLEVVSVWSPTYFLTLLALLDDDRDWFVRALTHLHRAGGPLKREADRAFDLVTAIAPAGELWPTLRILSCWDDGAARAGANALRALFPHALVQGKGLLATEGPMTLPLVGLSGGAKLPFLSEVVLELRDDCGRTHDLWSAPEGLPCQLLLSQRGGFLRYAIGDTVVRAGAHQNIPLLQFLGRSGGVSDLVGEKLDAPHVVRALAALGIGDRGVVVAPRSDDGSAHYTVLLPVEARLPAAQVARELEAMLHDNTHYALARGLGQLRAVDVAVVPLPDGVVADAWHAAGKRLGDLKPSALAPLPIPVAILDAHRCAARSGGER